MRSILKDCSTAAGTLAKKDRWSLRGIACLQSVGVGWAFVRPSLPALVGTAFLPTAWSSACRGCDHIAAIDNVTVS